MTDCEDIGHNDLLGDHMSFDELGQIITCPCCKCKFEVSYDEIWDGVDEHQIWELIRTD